MSENSHHFKLYAQTSLTKRERWRGRFRTVLEIEAIAVLKIAKLAINDASKYGSHSGVWYPFDF